MTLDIGRAFREGVSRTFSRNGLILAAVFAVVAVLTAVLTQSLFVAGTEAMLEFLQSLSPEEIEGMDRADYEQMIADMEQGVEQTRETSPLALGISPGLSAGGLLALALVAEAASIVAVRLFATEETRSIPGDVVADNILLATLNGFVGGIVVWTLIGIGLVLFVLPGIFLAVAFYFLRQEIALGDKNFVQAMADSWRTTKGYRLEVFLVALLVVLVSTLEPVGSSLGGLLSPLVAVLLASLVGGVLTAFGAAVVTRAYLQISDEEPVVDETEEDPYAKALGPDDIPG